MYSVLNISSVCMCVYSMSVWCSVGVQQKIRRDRERREERRMGGKQQVALRGQRDKYIRTYTCIIYMYMYYIHVYVYM